MDKRGFLLDTQCPERRSFTKMPNPLLFWHFLTSLEHSVIVFKWSGQSHINTKLVAKVHWLIQYQPFLFYLSLLLLFLFQMPLYVVFIYPHWQHCTKTILKQNCKIWGPNSPPVNHWVLISNVKVIKSYFVFFSVNHILELQKPQFGVARNRSLLPFKKQTKQNKTYITIA